MKKVLYAVCAAAVLASCSSKGEEENYSSVMESESISFGTYVSMNGNTRALAKTSFAENDELLLNAFQAEETTVGKEFSNNFMQNEVLTKTSTGWTYTNSKFWPMNSTDRISFLAVYPNIQPTITDGTSMYAFAVNDNAALQQDFMWSSITDAYRADRNGTHQNGVIETPATAPQNHVTLNFQHALSKILFKVSAKAYYSGATITVTDIVLNNLYGEGTYAIGSELAQGTWTATDEQDNTYTALSGGTVVASSSETKSAGVSLLLLPQTLNTDAEGASTVTIKYTVTYANPTKIVNEEKTFNLASSSLTAWEQNKVYNYNFTIALDLITFDATVDSWGGTSNTEIAVE